MAVVITGIGLCSALGDLETTWQHLLAGKSAVRLQQPFAELELRPLASIGQQPALLIPLLKQAVADALRDAELTPPLLDCGVVIGSSRSQQGQWEQLIRKLQQSSTEIANSPLNGWIETLPNSAAITCARQIGTTAPVLAPMAACATGVWAIAQGMWLLQMGQCQRVIAGAVEAPITPLTLTGFRQMGALAETGAYPFDRHREGLAIGEGAAVFVMETEELAKQRSASIYGRVLGVGLTADGYHISAPDPESSSAIAAVKQCLWRSGLKASEIDYIHAHGTATQLNDRNEAQLIQQLFSQGVAVSSTKGATGHTIGASGALGTAFCLMALKHQILPPCVGLQVPEFNLDFVTSPRKTSVQNTLCFSFGFGGQNAVVALGK
jgi:3-oxoacyl-[acyl-carrier-protein] synthase II